MKQMSNEENLVYKIFKSENSVNQDDIDMISIIGKYLTNYYIKKLNYLYFKAEQDQFFSSLLSQNELSTIINKENANKIIED